MNNVVECICCANGNDLPDGEYCRSCGRGEEPVVPQPKQMDGLAEAIKSARGGEQISRRFKGYA